MTTQIDATQQIKPGAVSTYMQTNGSGKVVWGAGAGASADYVLMSNGANPPSPMDDGAGNFLYVSYTP